MFFVIIYYMLILCLSGPGLKLASLKLFLVSFVYCHFLHLTASACLKFTHFILGKMHCYYKYIE